MTQSAPNTKALTSRGGGGQSVCVVPRPLASPRGQWDRLGRARGWPLELQKRVKREEAADAGSAALSCLSVSPAPPLCQSPRASMSSAHFNRGPAYGLSAEVKNKVRLEGTDCLGWTLTHSGQIQLPELPPTWVT